MKPLFISATAFLAFAASSASVGNRPTTMPWRTSHYENVLGTSMEIKLIAASDEAADRAEAAAMGEIKRLNSILSGYDPSSEFSRWAGTREEAVHVSPELVEVLQLWDSWRLRSNGALNPAAEAIARVWKRAETLGTMPTASDMSAAAKAASAAQWRLDEKSGTATRLTGTPLMLNSFTKSYVIERAAAAALQTPGVSGIVLNIGGDLVVRGIGSDKINVADPRSDAENSDPVAVLDISDRAIICYPAYREYFIEFERRPNIEKGSATYDELFR